MLWLLIRVILAQGGAFLTQQVHGLWAHDLIAVFGAKPQWPDATLDRYVPLLEAAGLTIADTRDWSGQISFTDVGAIVYYLRAVPWLVPGFSVATHSEQLYSCTAVHASATDRRGRGHTLPG